MLHFNKLVQWQADLFNVWQLGSLFGGRGHGPVAGVTIRWLWSRSGGWGHGPLAGVTFGDWGHCLAAVVAVWRWGYCLTVWITFWPYSQTMLDCWGHC